MEDIFSTFENFFFDTLAIIVQHQTQHNLNYKLQFITACQFVRNNTETDELEYHTMFIVYPNNTIKNANMFKDNSKLITDIMAYIDAYQHLGSNWRFVCVEQVYWKIVEYNRVRYYKGLGAKGKRGKKIKSANKRKKTSKQKDKIFATRALINVDNATYLDCFRWAVLSILKYKEVCKNRSRMASYYKWENELEFEGTKFPITIPQIKVFERNNPSIAINIFAYRNPQNENDTKPCLKILKQCSGKKASERTIINLLLHKGHYYGITNINRLLNSKQCVNSNSYRVWCERCITSFYNKKKLDQHREICYTGKRQVEIIPEQNSIKFNNFARMISPPFCAYADIECHLEKFDDKEGKGKIQKHVASAIGYILVQCRDIAKPVDFAMQYKQFIGANCIGEFLVELEKDAHLIYEWCNSDNNTRVMMNNEEWRKAMTEKQRAVNCKCCNANFIKDEEKIGDHNRYNGKFRAIVCKECNDTLRINRKYLPVVFHNFKNYD